jgi:hypothetical protein
MTALLHFPDTPAVSFCHGWLPWEEMPPRFPRVLRYVAVDHTCRDRLVAEGGVQPERVEVLLNFVDLQRFPPRSPLPTRPTRALVFSNYVHDGNSLPAIRRACADVGLALDVIGRGSNNACAAPERVLGGYDVVFAKARAALEALATGAAVVVCDATGCGPMVCARNFERLRRLNFGVRTLTAPATAERLVRELGRYDPADAAEVSRRLRAEGGRDRAVRRLVAIYEEVLCEWERAPAPDRLAENRAAAAYLQSVSPAFQERSRLPMWRECERLQRELEQSGRALVDEQSGRAELARECDALRGAEAAARGAATETTAAAADWRARAEQLQQTLNEIQASAALRLRAWVLRVPLLGRSARALLRGGRACWRGARGVADLLHRAAVRPRPVPFIVGVARSGTTLLRLMLDAHPELAIPAETGFIPAVAGLSGAADALREAVFQALTTAPTWEDLALSRETFRAALAEVEPFTVADGVRCFYRCYARLHGKARWGDKTPLHGLHLQTIQGLLPEARILHIIRDGRDVALSLRGLWFSPGDSAEALARHWRERIEATRAQAAGCRHYLEVRYEDLVRDPRGVLRGICRFLELPFCRAMEGYHRGARARLDEVRTRYRSDGTVLIAKEERLHLHRLTQRRPDAGRIGKWRSEMSTADVEVFERIAGGLLRELGYDTRALCKPVQPRGSESALRA